MPCLTCRDNAAIDRAGIAKMQCGDCGQTCYGLDLHAEHRERYLEVRARKEAIGEGRVSAGCECGCGGIMQAAAGARRAA